MYRIKAKSARDASVKILNFLTNSFNITTDKSKKTRTYLLDIIEAIIESVEIEQCPQRVEPCDESKKVDSFFHPHEWSSDNFDISDIIDITDISDSSDFSDWE